MKLFQSLSILVLCFSSFTFAMEPEEYNPILMWQLSQKIKWLEQQGIMENPLTRRQKIAEIKKMHDKIISKQRRSRNKNSKQRNLIGYQDTHLSHHGHRK